MVGASSTDVNDYTEPPEGRSPTSPAPRLPEDYKGEPPPGEVAREFRTIKEVA
jgi:hypothetical protein